VAAEIAELGAEDDEEGGEGVEPGGPPLPIALPFARRDLERLRLVLLAQRRLRESHAQASARRATAGKAYFEDAVRWLEIHGGEDGRELAALWRRLDSGPADPGAETEAPPEPSPDVAPGGSPRRRRRRRRRRPRSEPAAQG
jgi:hypothetical protein